MLWVFTWVPCTVHADSRYFCTGLWIFTGLCRSPPWFTEDFAGSLVFTEIPWSSRGFVRFCTALLLFTLVSHISALVQSSLHNFAGLCCLKVSLLYLAPDSLQVESQILSHLVLLPLPPPFQSMSLQLNIIYTWIHILRQWNSVKVHWGGLSNSGRICTPLWESAKGISYPLLCESRLFFILFLQGNCKEHFLRWKLPSK